MENNKFLVMIKKVYIIVFILFAMTISLCLSCISPAINNASSADTTDTLPHISFAEPDYEENAEKLREIYFRGGYLDTDACSNRDYAQLFGKYTIDSLERARVVERLYPLSVKEMNCFYDSLLHATGDRQAFFKMLDTVSSEYAFYDSLNCFRLFLNSTRYMDPRRIDPDWIAANDLFIYYYVIRFNLKRFKSYYDTCHPTLYFSMDEWLSIYNDEVDKYNKGLRIRVKDGEISYDTVEKLSCIEKP